MHQHLAWILLSAGGLCRKGEEPTRSAQSKRNGIDLQLSGECVAKLMDVVSCRLEMRRGLGERTGLWGEPISMTNRR